MITVNTSGKNIKEAVKMTTDALNKALKAQDQELQVFVDDTMSAFEIKTILENSGLHVLIQDDDGQMTLLGSTKEIKLENDILNEPEQHEDKFKFQNKNQNQEYNQETEKIEQINNINNVEKIKEIDKINKIDEAKNIEEIKEIKTTEEVKQIVQKKVSEKIEDNKSNKAEKNTVFLIMGKALGRDDNKLGEILIKGFLAGLVKSEPTPEAVILLNEGVKLALFDSSTCDHLKDLEARGTQILISGICTSHFGITDSIGAGVIANIYEIVDVINHAGKVVSL